MPTYGLKYQTQFTSQSDANIAELDYTLQFLFKDYTGEVATLTGGDVTVVQRCTVDDPVALVKGQSLDITLLNKGNIPITAFQSEDDDGVQVKLYQGSNLLFIGFLVQDDFYETKVDFAHTITLSANDGLGLLKGVILSEAEVSNDYSVILLAFTGLLDLFYVSVADTSFNPVVGGTIEVQGIVYDITSVTGPFSIVIGAVNYNYLIRVTPNTPGWSEDTETVTLTGPLNLLNRNRLSDIIYACLNQTNLSLLTYIYYNLYEYRQNPLRSTLEQTLIDSQTFISGDTYDNCYTVLEKIFKAVNITLFQANGVWNIVHWYEAKKYGNAIPGFIYDEQFKFLGNTILNNTFSIGMDPQLTRWTAGITEGALRGFRFTKRQFDYKQPKYLLLNQDLQLLGDLITTYTSGTDTYYEYGALYWTSGFPPTLCQRFIRVIKDTATNTETARYLVLRGAVSDSARAVNGTPFELSEGDKIKFSFSFKTNVSQAGSLTIIFSVALTDGTLTRYVDEVPVNNGNWIGSLGFNYTIGSGENSNEWHTVEIQSSQAPFGGLITVSLAQATNDPQSTAKETWYRDIRLEYFPFVADSLLITGQVHSQTKSTGPKLFSEGTIVIDDSPRNSIAGTLFNTTKTGLLQDRTLFWVYPTDSEGWRLGEKATLDELVWRAKTRSKFESGFIGNYQNGFPISLLTMAVFDFYPTKNYTFGLLTIDYKRNQFSGTLWELYDNNDEVLDAEYLLKYLYSTE